MGFFVLLAPVKVKSRSSVLPLSHDHDRMTEGPIIPQLTHKSNGHVPISPCSRSSGGEVGDISPVLLLHVSGDKPLLRRWHLRNGAGQGATTRRSNTVPSF
jgi:hypothetical protein